MTPQMQMELIKAFDDTAASDCRVLILKGAGDAFCSGLDLAELNSAHSKTVAEHRSESERLRQLFLTLYELPVSTIASVHGAAIAGGAGLAMICDFTLATSNAKFGFTEVRIGFVPAIISAFLALHLGRKQRIDLLTTGRIFAAEEALRLGLINEIVPDNGLAGRVEELTAMLLSNSPQAIRSTKRLIAAQDHAWLLAALSSAVESSVEARSTPDFREGVEAFLQKRKPRWTK
jgi:methylglutaconyl-CoA hydratase